MRVFCSLFLLLPACASHAVRCDGRLHPINQPAAPVVAPVVPVTTRPEPSRGTP